MKAARKAAAVHDGPAVSSSSGARSSGTIRAAAGNGPSQRMTSPASRHTIGSPIQNTSTLTGAMLAAFMSGPAIATPITVSRSTRPTTLPTPTRAVRRSSGPTSTSRRVAGHVARSTTAVPSMMATPM